MSLTVPKGGGGPTKQDKSLTKVGSRPSLTTIKSLVRSRSRLSQLAAESRSRLRAGSRVGFNDDGDGDEWLQARDPVKPPDQLELTDEELKVEFTRILRAENPNAPDNIVRFNHKEREFKTLATVEQLSMHFSLDGKLVHVDSDEARRFKARKNIRSKPKKEAATETAEAGVGPDDEGVGEGEPAAADGEGGEPAEGEAAAEGDSADAEPEPEPEEEEEDAEAGKVLRNQFNFSERASQTFNFTTKERSVATEPPPRSNFSATCTQWEIFDTYVAEKARQDEAKEKKKPHHDAKAAHTSDGPSFDRSSAATEENASMWAASAKIVSLDGVKKIERMVNQNSFDDILQDFKYWDDASDEVKPDEGSLLPLWTFINDKTKKKHITCLMFNPVYKDMLIAGYGSYNFAKQQGGAVACYTLKNPTFPEYFFATESGVMCIDLHPESVNLLAVGFYDGSVAVYDLHADDISVPTYKATALTGKHSDPVWNIKWQPDDLEKHKNFYSVSSDGRITSWTLRYAELQYHDVIKLVGEDSNSDEKASDVAIEAPPSAGTCFAFNKASEHLFLVGTEEGKVHKCSKAYSSKFLATFDAHQMVVYSVVWNKFHSQVFATCSADWSLKIWDHSYPKPLFQFDLGNPVGDVAWAPFSSTVFAAVTTDSRVHIFDLSKSKYEPICVQPIMKKGRLTHVEFNPIHPIIIVGDDRGSTYSLKLSPNLRKELSKKGGVVADAQVEKFQKLIDSVKELNIQTGEVIGEI